jgi:hypothetical protein
LSFSAQQINLSHQLHEEGTLLMSGAFIEKTDEPFSTKGVLTSREAAEKYIKGDQFVLKGMVSNWYIRESATPRVKARELAVRRGPASLSSLGS